MNESAIEQIKQKLDIVEEISAVVALKKAGKAFKGLCPFHNERTPSFYVFPETGTWRCFGCNEGGDIFTFVEKQQSLEFKDVLELLAEKAGVTLNLRRSDERSDEGSAQAADERQRLYALNRGGGDLVPSPVADCRRCELCTLLPGITRREQRDHQPLSAGLRA